MCDLWFLLQFLGTIFLALNFKAHKNFVLVIKNTYMVSFLFFSSFMHILYMWWVEDAQIRPNKFSNTQSQKTRKWGNNKSLNRWFNIYCNMWGHFHFPLYPPPQVFLRLISSSILFLNFGNSPLHINFGKWNLSKMIFKRH